MIKITKEINGKVVPVVQYRAELEYPAWLQGPEGDSGVYVGETEPTDPDKLVWINPAGTASEALATKGWVEEQNVSVFNNDAGYLTEHQSLEGYATEAYVEEAVAGVVVPTKVSELENDAGYLTEHQSLANYATKKELEQAIAEIPEPELGDYALKSDLAGLATTDYVDTAVQDVEVDLTGYATETYVNTKIAEAQLSGGETVDLSSYALKTDIPTRTSQLANDSGFLSEHQSLEGYATETYVDDAIKAISIPDTSGFITETQMKNYVDEVIGGIENGTY